MQEQQQTTEEEKITGITKKGENGEGEGVKKEHSMAERTKNNNFIKRKTE